MKGWTELCSDVNWVDYHGMWAKRARDGSWYVLSWTNLVDAGGKDFADTPYECSVKRLDLDAIGPKARASALKSCGWRETSSGLETESGDTVAREHAPLVVVECCIQHGLGAPLEDFRGAKHPLRIRAEARRYAETCMRDSDLLESRLDRPVNALYTSARNYGAGVIFASDREV